MTPRATPTETRQQGIALLISLLVLSLVSAIALTSIEHSGEEFAAGGRSRASTRALYAADAGVQLAISRIAKNDLSAFNFALANGTNVESRSRTDATPQPIASLGLGPPPEGYSINVGSGYGNEIFQVNVTALSPGGSSTQLETKLGRLAAGAGGY